MQTLGYRPNGAARALKSGRFHTIGVIMISLQTFGNIRTLDAIATEAAQRRLLGHAAADLRPDPAAGVSGAYQRLSAQAVDGAVIILEARLLDQAEFALPPGIPVVVIDSGAGPDYTVVDTDQALGARQATEHLLGLGHRQVWHIAGPQTSFSAARRAESWRAHAARGGHHAAAGAARRLDRGVRLPARPDPRPPSRRHRDLRRQRPDGARGDAGAARARPRHPRRHQHRRASTTWTRPRSFWPPLTTIRQDFAAVGGLSIQKLLAKVSNPTDCNRHHNRPHRPDNPRQHHLSARPGQALRLPHDHALPTR